MKKEINFKKHFDVLKKKELVFFDNAASTLKPKNVCDAVDYYNRYESVNAGRGIYKLAFEVTSKVERVREKIASFFKTKKHDFVFLKNTSEAVNLVAHTYVKSILKKNDEILVSDLEHNSNFLPWLDLCNKKQAKLLNVKSDKYGKVTFENFQKVVSDKTKFVALSFVNNTFGTVIDIEKIVNFCREKNIKILIDASQAVGHIKIDLGRLNPNFFVFSAYKMFAPTGVGVLGIEKEIAKNITPLFFGGGSVSDVVDNQIETLSSPQKFEVGTLNISGIIGLGEAVDFIENVGFEYIEKKEKKLKNYFLNEVKQIEGFTLYNQKPDLPIFLFNLKNIHAHDVATFYDEFNIMVRAGNHCAILPMKKIDQVATVRASLSFINTKKDIDKFVFETNKILEFFKKS